jgi:hypothetical protein
VYSAQPISDADPNMFVQTQVLSAKPLGDQDYGIGISRDGVTNEGMWWEHVWRNEKVEVCMQSGMNEGMNTNAGMRGG